MYKIRNVTTGKICSGEPSFSTYEEGKSYMDRYFYGSWWSLWYTDSDTDEFDLVEA